MHQIRHAEIEDAPALAGLLRRIGLWARINRLSEPETEAHVQAMLKLCDDDSHSLYLAIDEQGRPAGYLSAHWLPYLILAGPEGFISELFVDPGQRGQGIGTALLQAVETEARCRGCSRLSLLNPRGRESYERKFYEKHGWEERPDMANFIRKL